MITIGACDQTFHLGEKISPRRYVPEMSNHLKMTCDGKTVEQLIWRLRDFYLVQPPEMDADVKSLIRLLETLDKDAVVSVSI